MRSGLLLVLSTMAVAGGPSNLFLVPAPHHDTVTADSQTAKGADAAALPQAEDEILVQFSTGVTKDARASVHAQIGATPVKHFANIEALQLVKLPRGLSVKAALAHYRTRPDVLYAEPNFRVHVLRTPNDSSLGTLWGLHNTGQDDGASDADIDAPAAWELSRGSRGVVVAVIDTGIDYTHPDLAANMWRNTVDCNSNGVDDDGNGYIDDRYGVDTVNADGDPMDDHQHGTHVAGIIGAVGNNSIGMVGVNWRVRMMACKFLDANGFGSIADAIACLQYVQTMQERGVNIIATNNSWGGEGFSKALRNAIAAHRQRGLLFIAAAGNAASDNDFYAHYPSSYDLPNVIAVSATDRADDLAFFANFGRHTVHLGAPGHEIRALSPAMRMPPSAVPLWLPRMLPEWRRCSRRTILAATGGLSKTCSWPEAKYHSCH